MGKIDKRVAVVIPISERYKKYTYHAWWEGWSAKIELGEALEEITMKTMTSLYRDVYLLRERPNNNQVDLIFTPTVTHYRHDLPTILPGLVPSTATITIHVKLEDPRGNLLLDKDYHGKDSKSYPLSTLWDNMEELAEKVFEQTFEIIATDLKKYISRGMMKELLWPLPFLLLICSCAHMPAKADKIPGKPASVITELSVDTREDTILNRIGRRLAVHSKNGEDFYHFKLASPSEINAFTLPGGYVYVFTGLIRILETEDELAALLAHEIAHNEQRHYAEQYDWKLPLNILGEGLSLLTLGIVPNPIQLALSRKDEAEADRIGLELMVKAGFCAQGMSKLLEKLHNITSLRTPNKYVLTHPPTKERSRK